MTESPMNFNCKDRDRIFETGTPQEWSALELHAANCVDCSEELRAWKALSSAAQEMRDESAQPELWLKIRAALVQEQERSGARSKAWSWQQWWRIPAFRLAWQPALAGTLALVLGVSAVWFVLHRSTGPDISQSSPLLKDPALAEVERTEKAYEQAIEKLATQANPELENPSTPLLASYHEKILVIDSAISELRAQAGMNPSNAHLRRELLVMYQQKQETLEEVLEARPQ